MKTYLKLFGILKNSSASWKSVCVFNISSTQPFHHTYFFSLIRYTGANSVLGNFISEISVKNNYRRFIQQNALTVTWLFTSWFRKRHLLWTAQLLWTKLSAGCCWMSLLSVSFPDCQIKRWASRNGSSLIQLYGGSSTAQERR